MLHWVNNISQCFVHSPVKEGGSFQALAITSNAVSCRFPRAHAQDFLWNTACSGFLKLSVLMREERKEAKSGQY